MRNLSFCLSNRVINACHSPDLCCCCHRAAMEQVLRKYKIPDGVSDRIYEYLHSMQMRDVLTNHRLGWIMQSLSSEYDRGYTVRNYFEFWAVVPRYYDSKQKRMYGSYKRRRWRVTDPL